MSIYDVSNKNNPTIISDIPADNYVNYVLAEGNRVFAVDGQNVKMFNVTDPKNVTLEYSQAIDFYIWASCLRKVYNCQGIVENHKF
jgi:hypothetical protein